ncbi:hypothetical protein NIES25_05160 [Nostoc linckia NIES-25]|nr:hypothetical protein NIES25_05160 [Nostoc linckia NIES-25]
MVLLHFSGAINLRKICILRKGAKEEDNSYAECYACVKIRKSCVAN